MPKRLVVALTGASGVVYGVRALQFLRTQGGVETHLIITKAARANLAQECDMSAGEVRELADVVHSDGDLGAPISSGSYRTAGMLVAPCSVKTLSGIANSYDESLVVRAADVMLKERRPVVLLLRETPLHAGHLRLMCDVTAAGAIVMPPVPAFYLRPESVADIVDHTVGRALDLLDAAPANTPRWSGHAAGEHALPRRADADTNCSTTAREGGAEPRHTTTRSR